MEIVVSRNAKFMETTFLSEAERIWLKSMIENMKDDADDLDYKLEETNYNLGETGDLPEPNNEEMISHSRRKSKRNKFIPSRLIDEISFVAKETLIQIQS